MTYGLRSRMVTAPRRMAARRVRRCDRSAGSSNSWDHMPCSRMSCLRDRGRDVNRDEVAPVPGRYHVPQDLLIGVTGILKGFPAG